MPIVGPEVAVAFEEGAELADGSGASFAPAHAGAFEALAHDGFAGGHEPPRVAELSFAAQQ